MVARYGEALKQDPQFGVKLRRLCRDFEERFNPGAEDGLTDSFYMNWFVLDNRFGVDQHTIIERMMEDQEFHSLSEEIKIIFRELSDSYATCYELKKVLKDNLQFEELVTGRQWLIHRMDDPFEQGRRGEIWHVRFVGPEANGYYFGQPFIFDPEAKSDFTKIVKHQISCFKEYASTRSLKFEIPRDAFKASTGFWSEYLYRSSPNTTTKCDEDIEDYSLKPIIQTTDGEKMRFSSIIFKIMNKKGLREKLSQMRNLDYDDNEHYWLWFKKGVRGKKSSGNTVLGRIFIDEGQLIGETNSLERALRLKNKLSIGLGKMVVFEKINSKDHRAMPDLSEQERLEFEEEQRRINADPKLRRFLIQHLERYYLTDWISSKIPAIGNKTPLQAVKTRKGTLQLEVLINRMEAMENSKPSYSTKFDMNLLREKLGLPLAIRNQDK